MGKAPKEEDVKIPLLDGMNNEPSPVAYGDLIKSIVEGCKAGTMTFADHLQRTLLPVLEKTKGIIESTASQAVAKAISKSNEYVDKKTLEEREYLGPKLNKIEEALKKEIMATASGVNESIRQYLTETLLPEYAEKLLSATGEETDKRLNEALEEYQKQETEEEVKVKQELEAILSKLKILEENGASKGQLQSAVEEFKKAYDQKLADSEQRNKEYRENVVGKLDEVGETVNRAVEDRLSATASNIEKKIADAREKYTQTQKQTEEKQKEMDAAFKKFADETREQLKNLGEKQTSLEKRVESTASAEGVAKLTKAYNEFRDTHTKLLEGVTRIQNTREELVNLVKNGNAELVSVVESAKGELNTSVKEAVTDYASKLILSEFKKLAPDLLPQLMVAITFHVDRYLKGELPKLLQQILHELMPKVKEPEPKPFFGASLPKPKKTEEPGKLSDLLRDK